MKKHFVLVGWFVLVILSTSALAFNPTGTYSYKEKGFSGEMKVTETGISPAVLKIQISTVSPQAHTCDVEAEEQRLTTSEKEITSLFVSKEPGTDSAKFTVKFTPKGALINVDNDGGSCGLNAMFGGKWIKDSTKKVRKIKR